MAVWVFWKFWKIRHWCVHLYTKESLFLSYLWQYLYDMDRMKLRTKIVNQGCTVHCHWYCYLNYWQIPNYAWHGKRMRNDSSPGSFCRLPYPSSKKRYIAFHAFCLTILFLKASNDLSHRHGHVSTSSSNVITSYWNNVILLVPLIGTQKNWHGRRPRRQTTHAR